jgi:hypothetical protein
VTTHTDLTCHAGDVPLTVMSTPADHDALARHVTAYLAGRIGELHLPGYQIHVHTDPVLFRTAAATFADLAVATVQPVPGVTLSEGHIGTVGRCYTVAADVLEGRPGAWAVQVEGPVIDLYVAERAAAPKYALRVIREVMLRTYESASGLVFHAAGLDIAGRTVMICANRGAGKTTTLAALLHGLGGRGALLSNDRLIIHGQRRVVAVPLPVPVARGTLEAFPELWAAAPAGEADTLPRRFGTRDKTALSARTFATAFGSRLVPGSALHILLVPRFTDTAQPP